MTSQRSDRSFGILATSALVLLSPLWLTCDATQPRPPCRAQMQKYAAKYTMVGTPRGNCAGKIPSAELVNMQYYRTKPNDNSVAPTLAIEAQSVFDAVTAANDASRQSRSIWGAPRSTPSARSPGTSRMTKTSAGRPR